MRLLNDEESPYFTEYLRMKDSENGSESVNEFEAFKAGNKAQYQQDLKDFIEWGDEACCEVDHVHTAGIYNRKFCLTCWASL